MVYNVPLESFVLPADLYRLGTIIYTNSTTKNILSPTLGPNTPVTTTEDVEVERINANEFLYINSSPLTKPKNVRPIYVANTSGIKVYGDVALIANVKCNYIKEPVKVEWKYQMVYGEALYDSTYSINFQLHPSEETELVVKVLALAGLVIKDIQMYQIASGEEATNTQQEKS